MAIRVTAIFGDRDQAIGWSESYLLRDFPTVASWTEGGPGILAPLSAQNQFRGLRRNLLAAGTATSKGAYLWKIRVSVVGNFRTMETTNYSSADARGTYAPGNVESVDPTETWTRLLIDLKCGEGPHGRLFVGGCPETQLAAPNTYRPVGKFEKALDDMIAFLRGNHWYVSRRKTRGNNLPPITPLTRFDVQPDLRSAIVAPSTIGIGGAEAPPIGYVVIRGRHPCQWNGVHRYQRGTAAGTLLLGPARGPTTDEGAPGTGTIQLYAQQEESFVTLATPLRFVQRKTGQSPFVFYRGRRRRLQ